MGIVADTIARLGAHRNVFRRKKVLTRKRQAGFVNIGAMGAALFGRKFTPQDLFRAGEVGAHYEVNDPTALLARRNLATWAEDISNPAWSKLNCTITGTDLITVTASTSTYCFENGPTNIPVNQLLTVSAEGVPGNSTKFGLYIGNTAVVQFTLSGAGSYNISSNTSSTGVQAGITANGDGSYRCWITATCAIAGPNWGFHHPTMTAGETVRCRKLQLERGTLTDYQKITDWNTEYIAACLERIALWQDSSGATACTGPEQPVGMWLDAKGNVVWGRGPDIAPALTTANWAVFNNDSTHIVTWQPGTGFRYQSDTTSPALSVQANGALVAGRWYEVTITVTNWVSGNMKTDSLGTAAATGFGASGQGNGTYRVKGKATGTSFSLTRSTTNVDLIVSAVTIREVPAGAHALQSVNNSRPMLKALYNLLLKTEQIADAVWVKTFAGTGVAPVITDRFGIAPDGTQTATRVQYDRGTGTTSSDFSYLAQGGLTTSSLLGRGKVWIKSNTAQNYQLKFWGPLGSGPTVTADQTWKLVDTGSQTIGSANAVRLILFGDTGASQTADVLIWHPDFRVEDDWRANLPPYQRVNVTTTGAADYDTVGFPFYLKFDGFDDSLVTDNIDFTSVDKVTLWAGSTKYNDTTSMVVELGSGVSSTTAGAFNMYFSAGLNGQVGVSSGNFYTASVSGTVQSTGQFSCVRCNQYDLSTATANCISQTYNGITDNTSRVATGTPVTGVFGNLPLNIGSRSSALRGNQRITAITARGSTTPASQAFIAKMNRWIANLMAVTI